MAGAAFVSNLALLHGGYFETSAQLKPLRHLWSLGIEEQFYIFLASISGPALEVHETNHARDTGRRLCFIHAQCSAGCQAPARNLFPSPDPRLGIDDQGPRLAGSLLRLRVPRTRTRITNTSLAALGSALILLAFLLLDENRPFPGWWALLPTTGTALLIEAGSAAWINQGRIGIALRCVHRPDFSYPLYLWHWPALVYLKMITASDFALSPSELALARGAVLAASIVLAWATWMFVETPIRRAKSIFGPARIRALIAAMVAVALFGALSFAKIVTARLDKPAIAEILKATNDWDYPTDKHERTPDFTVEVIPSFSRQTTLFVGDSHMEQYPGHARNLRSNRTRMRRPRFLLRVPAARLFPD